MYLSVIIPTCNRNHMLALCLDKLAAGMQTLDAAAYEVIVTDDGSIDTAESMIAEKYPRVKWVEGPKRGPAANRNNGAKQALGEWLVFTDDDCLPDRNWLSAWQQAIVEHAGCRAFEGAILPDNRELLKKDMAECPVNETGGCFWSANIMVKKALFEVVGGFDEQFKIAAQEDQDIMKRLLCEGPVLFMKESIVIHPVRLLRLTTKIAQSAISVKNWYLYSLKYNSFIETFFEGLSSQAKAFVFNLKRWRLKSCFYNIYVLLIYIPLIVSYKIKRFGIKNI